jgi:hypothetical protein
MGKTYTIHEVLILLDEQKNICADEYYNDSAMDNEVESKLRILKSNYPEIIKSIIESK